MTSAAAVLACPPACRRRLPFCPSMQDWLMERGLEGAVAPRSSKGTQEALRRHGEARPAVPAGSDGAPPPQALEGAGTQPAHRSGHPPEQQARAGSHGAEQECGAGAGAGAGAGNVSGPQQATAGAGLAAASAAPGGAELGAAAIQARLVKLEQRPAYNLRGSGGAPGGAPRFRDGKRAFLRALPQLATAGPTPHEVCWQEGPRGTRPQQAAHPLWAAPCCAPSTPHPAFPLTSPHLTSCHLPSTPLHSPPLPSTPLHSPNAAVRGAAVPLLDARRLGRPPAAPGSTRRGARGRRHTPTGARRRPALRRGWQRQRLRRQPGTKGAPSGQQAPLLAGTRGLPGAACLPACLPACLTGLPHPLPPHHTTHTHATHAPAPSATCPPACSQVSLGPGVHDERPQSVKEKLEVGVWWVEIALGRVGVCPLWLASAAWAWLRHQHSAAAAASAPPLAPAPPPPPPPPPPEGLAARRRVLSCAAVRPRRRRACRRAAPPSTRASPSARAASTAGACLHG